MEEKECKQCGKIYPATTEFYHKDYQGIFGLKSKCRFCINKSKFRVCKEGFHYCRICEQELPFTEEFFVLNYKSGRLTSPCRKCRNLKYSTPKHKIQIKEISHDITNFKECIICKKKLNNDITNFHKDLRYNDGLSCKCNTCYEKYLQENIIIHRCKRTITIQNTPHMKLRKNTRSRIKAAVSNNAKRGKSLDLLGCSIQEYVNFLNNKLSAEMTWENYGKIWQIDHIIPCYNYDLSDKNAQFECFNYKNTQPLFSSDNFKKRGSYSVIYKTSNNYINNNYDMINKFIIDDR